MATKQRKRKEGIRENEIMNVEKETRKATLRGRERGRK